MQTYRPILTICEPIALQHPPSRMTTPVLRPDGIKHNFKPVGIMYTEPHASALWPNKNSETTKFEHRFYWCSCCKTRNRTCTKMRKIHGPDKHAQVQSSVQPHGTTRDESPDPRAHREWIGSSKEENHNNRVCSRAVAASRHSIIDWDKSNKQQEGLESVKRGVPKMVHYETLVS